MGKAIVSRRVCYSGSTLFDHVRQAMNYQLALTAGFCLTLVTTLAHAQRPEPLMPVGDSATDAAGLETPHPVSATASRLMLDLPVTEIDPVRIDYAKLPRVPCQAAVISDGFGWIARGLWVRDGQLLALASHFNAAGLPGQRAEFGSVSLGRAERHLSSPRHSPRRHLE